MLVMRDLLARRSEAAALRVEDLTFAEDGGGLTGLAGLRQDCQRPPVPCDPQERCGEAVAP